MGQDYGFLAGRECPTIRQPSLVPLTNENPICCQDIHVYGRQRCEVAGVSICAVGK